MTTRRAETIAHNRAAIRRMIAEQSRAAVTGATCPACGAGVHPMILARFGHCLTCHQKDTR